MSRMYMVASLVCDLICGISVHVVAGFSPPVSSTS